MKYLIKINRKSIKKNPNAGRREFAVPGPTNLSGTGYFQYKYWDEIQHKYLMNIQSMEPVDRGVGIELNSHPERLYKASFVFRNSEEFDGIRKDKMFTRWWGLTEERPVQVYRTIHPEPSWLYGYIDKIVKCKHCKGKFSYTKLKEDYIDCPVCGGDEFHAVNICPKCGEFSCCEVEYEDINNVINADM